MRSKRVNATFKAAVSAVIFLLLTAAVSLGQVTVTLTASRQTTILPDGNTVPMWGWTCDAASATAGNCLALNRTPQTGGTVWQPPLITAPYVATGTSLTINLTNNLPVETSLVIVGQLPGGGLGTPVRESGPRTDGAHAGQTSTTWTTVVAATFTPPAQGQRVRSFVTEATPNTGTASYTWSALKPGTYLIESGTYPSIQGPMGLYGVLVVTTAPTTTAAGTAYSGCAPLTPATCASAATTNYSINYDADVPLLLSEIDPVQNSAVEQLVETSAGCPTATPGTGTCTGSLSAAMATAKWTQACGAAHTCYPAAVNYTPLYFLMNGQAFNKTLATGFSSAAPVGSAASTGNVLLRFVNAGLHMHVPSVNGLSMSLIAEDSNVLADVALGAAKTTTVGTVTTATPNLAVRVQNEVFLPAGKVYDVMINPANTATPTAAGTFTAANYQVFDRELSLSTNGSARDGGMQTVLQVAGGGAWAATNPTIVAPATYYCVPGVTLNVSDTGKGVIGQDVNVYGVSLLNAGVAAANHTITPFGAAGGTDSLTLNPNGTFTYTQAAANTTCGGSFTYSIDGTATTQTANITPTTLTTKPVANNDSYVSNLQSLLRAAAPGVLANDTDSHNSPLCAAPTTATSCPTTGQTLTATAGTAKLLLKPDGSFLATNPGGAAGTATFSYVAINAEKAVSNTATITVNFQAGSGLQVRVQDAKTQAAVSDYKWIIEQDLTFQIDPTKQVNSGGTVPPPTLGTNLNASYMPVVAVGCTGPQSCERAQTVYDPTTNTHVPAVCDGGICVPASTLGASSLPVTLPGDVNLPTADAFGRPAYYYISVLPGDAANAFNTGNAADPTVAGNCTAATTATGVAVTSNCGHTMGGAPIAPGQTQVTVNVEPNPLPTATVVGWVFEDDWPLNGEPDTGGGVEGGTNAQAFPTVEPGLEDFSVLLWDDAGGSGDATGQMTYDMFNMPLTNALNGTIDPLTGLDACPISNASGQAQQVGTIIVCPKFESDGVTLSPLVGQFVIENLMPGRFGVIVHPGARREANGEEWLQTNTLDGSHLLDSFVKAAEPHYFQEYGPGGYHVFFGMANPKIINGRLPAICSGALNSSGAPATGTALNCTNTVKVQVTNLHQGRSPNEQLYSSMVGAYGSSLNYSPLNYTTCYASLGDTDGATFAFQKCDENGNVTFTGVPDGEWGLVVFDQWVDFIVDGSSKSLNVNHTQACNSSSSPGTCNVNYAAFTWQTHLWNRSYMDTTGRGSPVLLGDGTLDPLQSPGLIQTPVRIRMRNGKFSNTQFTNFGGEAHFDETFPLFAFYVAESDTTRFRGTGVHVVNDNGGALDASGPYAAVLNSAETYSLPADLSVPGAIYCASGDAACNNNTFLINPTGLASRGTAGSTSTTSVQSTGRIDPGTITTEGWQGGLSEFDMIDWGKQPYYPGENGGIRGHVVYSSTRPFDDPGQLFQNLWEPLVPGVTINLYEEGTAADGTQTLTLVDTTTTSSWDAWAQGFAGAGQQGFGGGTAPNGTAVASTIPNMNCPGQPPTDPFYSYTLENTTNYLNPTTAVPHNSQYKCYDGYHNLNQVQPAPYDGLYHFPSPYCSNNPGGTIPGTTIVCATVTNPAYGIAGQTGAVKGVLPSQATCQAGNLNCTGKYVVEAVTPPNYEITKEEDKNILIGDNFIAPATMQFGAISNIFIVPDQATIGNANSCFGTGGGCTNPTTDLGRTFNIGGFGPGGNIVMPAPCVGQMRIVPDYMSISPEGGEVAPFAGATRPLCDRKEITLNDQMESTADFFVWTKTPAASHFTGFITDDFSSEFDPAAPAFGEKFAVPNVPVAIKDYAGVEISRVYSDQWGSFNGVTFSTWQVDPPNPTGYAPGMMITCMNDPGPIKDTRVTSPTFGQMITDPLFNSNYSTFCYENPFMPADTAYLDTPVVPTSAFAEGYNPPDCAYPDATPAIKSVTGSVAGPWVSATGQNITITALGDVLVANNGYSGPAATVPPYNQKFITRHYGFGNSRGSVRINGEDANVSSWSDSTIVASVPGDLSLCSNSNPAYGVGGTSNPNFNARCGELVITAANGKQSIDTVTITAGGKTPTVLAAGQTIQSAIDAASPGDLIIVPPGKYYEMLLMWKPVRLQGVGAASSVVDSNTHPAAKLIDPWRRKVACLFGLSLDGAYINNAPVAGGGTVNPYDSSGTYSCPYYSSVTGQLTTQSMVDQIPLETVIGWDVTQNGNIAELLQEPSLMGAYEGAGITVLAKGLENNNQPGVCDNTTVGGAPINNGCIPLNACAAYANPLGACTNSPTSTVGGAVVNNTIGDCNTTSPFYKTNYLCNPSRIDGLTFADSSQGGGGMFIHGYAHYLEVANNRVYNNAGTLGGGIILGQAETPPPTFDNSINTIIVTTPGSGYTCPGTATTCNVSVTISVPPRGGVRATAVATVNATLHQVTAITVINPGRGYITVPTVTIAPPARCTTGCVTATATAQLNPGVIEQAFMLNHHVYIHNNSVTQNTAYGDELNSTTPAAAGGVTVCDGSDYYKFQFNWVCGNLSTGNGGGMSHFGFSYYGDIEHNTFLFNQSTNPTLPTHGGGLIIEGVPPDGTVCEGNANVADFDCAPALSDGIGPGLVVNANLIQGNTAESGSGGGLRFQHVNGSEVQRALTTVVSPATTPNTNVLANCTLNNNTYFTPGSFGAGSFGDAPNQCPAYRVRVTNNIIANNVAGWAGGGISIHNAIGIDLINNTVASNDTTASAGVLFDAGGAPNASTPPPGCDPTIVPPPPACSSSSITTSTNQPSGLATEVHDANFLGAMAGATGCIPNHPNCKTVSTPIVLNDLLWQNRAFHISVGTAGTVTTTTQTQSSVVLNPTLKQATTGQCVGGASYLEIGVIGGSGGSAPAPQHSIVSDSGTSNFVSQYCNGSRVPPEIANSVTFCTAGSGGANNAGCLYPGSVGVPAGVPDASNSTPPFGLSPAATVDEGNNWINLYYGPLSTVNSSKTVGAAAYGEPLGDYALRAHNNAGVANMAGYPPVPATDFFGHSRTGGVDAGAVQFTTGASASTGGPSYSVLPNPLNFGNVQLGATLTTATAPVLSVDVNNTGDTALTRGTAAAISGTNANQFAIVTNGCTATSLPIAGTCAITVRFLPTSAGVKTATLSISYGGVSQPVTLTGAGWAAVTVTPATTATAPYSFGAVAAGTTSAPTTFTLTNPAGNPTLNIAAITFSSTYFYRDGPAGTATGGTCGSSLGGGATCTILVVFSPPPSTQLGVATSATMSVFDNAPNSPQTASLTGTY
ncbi:MAG: hypothetical protein DMG69_09605 [Acidobacteria bacterium]|nr:MAG: hypothetical protein DMG69_09605 [Acidobacteriota bacterium]